MTSILLLMTMQWGVGVEVGVEEIWPWAWISKCPPSCPPLPSITTTNPRLRTSNTSTNTNTTHLLPIISMIVGEGLRGFTIVDLLLPLSMEGMEGGVGGEEEVPLLHLPLAEEEGEGSLEADLRPLECGVVDLVGVGVIEIDMIVAVADIIERVVVVVVEEEKEKEIGAHPLVVVVVGIEIKGIEVDRHTIERNLPPAVDLT